MDLSSCPRSPECDGSQCSLLNDSPTHTHTQMQVQHTGNSTNTHYTSSRGCVNADGLNVSYLPDSSWCTPPQGEPPICQRESDGSSASFDKALLRGLVCISHWPGSQRSATRRPAAPSNTPGPGKGLTQPKTRLWIQATKTVHSPV